MRLTIHLDIVSMEADLYGDRGRMNRAFQDLRCLVLSKYNFKALTEHTNRSFLTEYPSDMFGRKIGCGVKISIGF